MKFPKVIRHRKIEATIYGKTKKYPFYRLAYYVAGKRVTRSFKMFGEAKTEAERLVREISNGSQAAALTGDQSRDALAAFQRLENFRQSTGRRFSLLAAASDFVEALEKLKGRSLGEAVEGYLQTIVTVRRKDIAEAVEEFLDGRKHKTKAKNGKRAQLSDCYETHVSSWLREFAKTFPATAACDLTKNHLNLYVKPFTEVSAKNRNDRRAAVKMFLSWATRQDYLPTNHRLFEADGMTRETVDASDTDFFRPAELRKLLDNADDALLPVLPELITAVKAGETVFIAEGEKDVAALVAKGFTGTCNAAGAGKWRDEFAKWFDGAKAVCIIADKDAPGRKHAVTVAANVSGKAQSVKVIELPDVAGRTVKDAHDFFEAGGTADQLRELAEAAPEFEPLANAAEGVTPNDWFKKKFPALAETHGDPVSLHSKNNRTKASDLNESFMAATLGESANPGEPTVYLRGENRFYSYSPKQGIYLLASEEDISARLSALLLSCARACKDDCDVDALAFGLRDSSALAGAVKRAKSLNVVPDNFFSGGMEEFLPVGNGVLRVSDRTLLPYSPQYHFRNKLAVDYIPGAKCPMFENVLLGNSLDYDDIGLLQRWCGLALVGRNIAQAILILSGTAGAGKGTFIRVLKGIIGEANIGSLRTEQLNQRFEIGRLIDRTLLYGADVAANFLSNENASVLKSLTGGDPITVELKSSMAAPSLTCEFNIVATSNSRLVIHLEGDVAAWQRRLKIIRYEKPKPANVIPDLEKKILAGEASGVLNWMLDGLYALRSANWQLVLSPGQKARVDELLLESNSVNVFFADRAIADTAAEGLTVTDAFAAYSDFCMDRGWTGLSRNLFGRDCLEIAQRLFRVTSRHDIKGADGKKQRGWKGFRLLAATEEKPC